ncbi:MAG: VOC family protein [Acidimicrobiia bacterium]|nr:VOC family protein [Acidimicrobiia bacterium]
MAATTRIDVNIDCVDADAQLEFWCAALGYEPFGRAGQYRSLVPPDGVAGPKLILQQTNEAKSTAKNRLHLDLIVGDAIDAEVERLTAIGAARVDDRMYEEAESRWVIMADPEGNEFCLCEN